MNDRHRLRPLKAGQSRPRKVQEVCQQLVQSIRLAHKYIEALLAIFVRCLPSCENPSGTANARQRVAYLVRQTCGELTRRCEPLYFFHLFDIATQLCVHALEFEFRRLYSSPLQSLPIRQHSCDHSRGPECCQLDDLILRIQWHSIPVTMNGWRLQHRGKKRRFQRSAPAEP